MLDALTVEEILKSHNLKIAKITKFPGSGQRQVFDVKFIDGKTSILKFIEITPYESIETQMENSHYGRPIEELEFEKLKEQEIERNSKRIKREIQASKEVSIFPKFEIFDDLQKYQFEQIIFLYYFEEKVDGIPLKHSDFYSSSMVLSINDVLDFVRRMLILIKVMHNSPRKYVHRDITPANILVDASNTFHLIDAGLVKSREDETITRHESAIGTKRYRAAEQERIIEDYDWDFRTDIFSVGLIAIELFLHEVKQFQDDELRDLHEILNIWLKKDDSYRSRRVFSKIIVKLSNSKRVKRSNSIDGLINEIDQILGGEE